MTIMNMDSLDAQLEELESDYQFISIRRLNNQDTINLGIEEKILITAVLERFENLRKQSGWASVRYLAGKYLEKENEVDSIFNEVEKKYQSGKDSLIVLQDIGALYRYSRHLPVKQFLKEEYRNSETFAQRQQAGKDLGYSKLRIWVHENPWKELALGLILGCTLAYEHTPTIKSTPSQYQKRK